MKHSLDTALTARSLKSLAGSAVYQRGKGYFDSGLVSGLRRINSRLKAVVTGTDDYQVTLGTDLATDTHGLQYDCSCPMGEQGDCCKHVVATGLAWLAQQGKAKSSGKAIQDKTKKLHDFLMQQSNETLTAWLLQQCEQDQALQQELESKAALSGSAPEISELKQLVRGALPGKSFVPYQRMREVIRRACTIAQLVEELLNDGHQAVAAELADYAMQRGIAAYTSMDDSGGSFGELLQELSQWHLRAFEQAGAAYPLQGKTFFKFKQIDDWGFFRLEDYVPLFSDKEYQQYKKLAQAAWDKVPEVTPAAGRLSDRISFSDHYWISFLMQELARHEKDIDLLVQIKSRDLSSPYRFLDIAQVLKQAGRDDEALSWAERGSKAFPDIFDRRLTDFLVREYGRRKQQDKAVELAWRQFRQQPCLDAYTTLKTAAEADGCWPARREQALGHLQTLDKETRRNHWARNSGSMLLIDIYLWEKDIDSALRTADDSGARASQWLTLARVCETDRPADAARIYCARLDDIVDRKTNGAYDEGADQVKAVRRLLGKTGQQAQFNRWLEEVRTRHKAKRNFMQRLEGIQPFPAG